MHGFSGSRRQPLYYQDVTINDCSHPRKLVNNKGCFDSKSFGRVDLGGCPPRAPTDPDLWDYHIRLLESRVRCGTINRVNNSGARQRITL